jgi:hypothetical protein
MEIADQGAGNHPGSCDGPERNGESGNYILERRNRSFIAEQSSDQPTCGKREAVSGER